MTARQNSCFLQCTTSIQFCVLVLDSPTSAGESFLPNGCRVTLKIVVLCSTLCHQTLRSTLCDQTGNTRPPCRPVVKNNNNNAPATNNAAMGTRMGTHTDNAQQQSDHPAGATGLQLVDANHNNNNYNVTKTSTTSIQRDCRQELGACSGTQCKCE